MGQNNHIAEGGGGRGAYGFAVGRANVIDASFGVAIGDHNHVGAPYAIAIGHDCSAGFNDPTDARNQRGMYAMAMGYRCRADGLHSIALGYASRAGRRCQGTPCTTGTGAGGRAVAIGYCNDASGQFGTAIGGQNIAAGYGSTAIGVSNETWAEFAVTMGYRNFCKRDGQARNRDGIRLFCGRNSLLRRWERMLGGARLFSGDGCG